LKGNELYCYKSRALELVQLLYLGEWAVC